jgi:hypothetical protein
LGTFNIVYTYSDTNSCTVADTLVTVVDACTGIDASEGQHAIQVYPNPGNGLFNFVLPGNNEYQISLFNALGELIFKDNISNTEFYTLDKTSLARGIYWVRFVSSNRIESLYLVVQ